MIYEHLKKLLRRKREEKNLLDCMAAAGLAKFTASSICYPHGKKHKVFTMSLGKGQVQESLKYLLISVI